MSSAPGTMPAQVPAPDFTAVNTQMTIYETAVNACISAYNAMLTAGEAVKDAGETATPVQLQSQQAAMIAYHQAAGAMRNAWAILNEAVHAVTANMPGGMFGGGPMFGGR